MLISCKIILHFSEFKKKPIIMTFVKCLLTYYFPDKISPQHTKLNWKWEARKFISDPRIFTGAKKILFWMRKWGILHFLSWYVQFKITGMGYIFWVSALVTLLFEYASAVICSITRCKKSQDNNYPAMWQCIGTSQYPD